MTSSLGDQLGALLGDATSSVKNDQEELEVPPGVHGDVVGVVKQVAAEVPSVELTTALSEYGLDRLGVVELAVRCEEELGVRVEDEDIAGFTTLGDVVDYIVARRNR